MILDICLVILLIVTLFYVTRLSIQLRRIRLFAQDISPALRSLTVMTEKQDQQIKKMDLTSESLQKNFHEESKKANDIIEDLRFLTEHGDKIYQRIESKLEELKKYEQGFLKKNIIDTTTSPQKETVKPIRATNFHEKDFTEIPSQPSFLAALKGMR